MTRWRSVSESLVEPVPRLLSLRVQSLTRLKRGRFERWLREEGRRDEGTLGVGFLGFVEKNRKRIGLVRELKKRLSFFRGFFGVEFFKNSSRARIFPDYVSLSLEITRVPGGRSPRSENKTATPLPSCPSINLFPWFIRGKGTRLRARTTFIPLCHEDINIRVYVFIQCVYTYVAGVMRTT